MPDPGTDDEDEGFESLGERTIEVDGEQVTATVVLVPTTRMPGGVLAFNTTPQLLRNEVDRLYFFVAKDWHADASTQSALHESALYHEALESLWIRRIAADGSLFIELYDVLRVDRAHALTKEELGKRCSAIGDNARMSAIIRAAHIIACAKEAIRFGGAGLTVFHQLQIDAFGVAALRLIAQFEPPSRRAVTHHPVLEIVNRRAGAAIDIEAVRSYELSVWRLARARLAERSSEDAPLGGFMP
jgi:hypothetical protein